MSKIESKNILLVEDEVFIAMSQKLDLEKCGYNVEMAHSGEQAIEAVQGNADIHLILMDIDLGQNIDGTETAEMILKERDVPVVFLSSHTEPDIVRKTEKITSYGYVVKNTGITILDTSIKMAFRLFEEKQRVKEHELQLIASNKELEKSHHETSEAEDSLHESEEKYRLLFERESDAVFIYDPDTKNILDANKATSIMYGYKKDELIGMSCLKFSAEVKKSASTVEVIREKGEIKVPTRYHVKKDGTIFTVEVNGYAIKLSGKEVMFAISKDITERKKAEEEIQRKYEENKILLSELQHRTKNNFNLISRMIELMERSTDSDETKAVLAEIMTRVGALSNMHNMLHDSESVTEVSLSDYLDKILSPLPGLSDNITLKIASVPVTVRVKTAITIGLILIELVINAIKYAFPENRNGTISVKLKKKNTGIALVVADNGIGLPPGFDFPTANTLGFTLIRAMLVQLGAECTVESKKGTKCSFEIPINVEETE